MNACIGAINKDSLNENESASMGELRGPTLKRKTGEAFLKAISTGCEALVACARQLNLMDKEHWNGDYGTRLARAAEAVQLAIQKNEIHGRNLYLTFKQISCIIRETLDDDSIGEIYSEFFCNIAEGFLKHESEIEVTAFTWLNALMHANKAMQAKVFPVEEQAFLISLVAVENDLKNALDQGLDFLEAYEAAVNAAESFTARVLNAPKAEKSKGPKYPDPRAHAVGIWMRGSFEGTKLKLAHTINKS